MHSRHQKLQLFAQHVPTEYPASKEKSLKEREALNTTMKHILLLFIIKRLHTLMKKTLVFLPPESTLEVNY